MDWNLYFRSSTYVATDAYEAVVAAVAGQRPATTYGELLGNPRDCYTRTITITATRDGVGIEMNVLQAVRAPDDPEPHNEAPQVILRAPGSAYAQKYAIWRELADALAKLGCTDLTAETTPTAIVMVVEAEDAGDRDTAQRVRGGLRLGRKEEAKARRRVRELQALDAAARRELEEHAAPPPSAPAPPPPAPVALTWPEVSLGTTPPVEVDLTPQLTFEDGVLEIGPVVTLPWLRRLVESGAYRTATKLVFLHTVFDDACAEYLARCGGFPWLVGLELSDISETGVGAFTNDAVGLDQLQWIALGKITVTASGIDGRTVTGISDSCVGALARTLRLPALQRIIRWKEWRFLPEGREDREIIEIHRPDGRVVKSIIDHTIWP